jgi:hypothetical protein
MVAATVSSGGAAGSVAAGVLLPLRSGVEPELRREREGSCGAGGEGGGRGEAGIKREKRAFRRCAAA